jgi:hypothetical protein
MTAASAMTEAAVVPGSASAQLAGGFERPEDHR